MSTPYFNSASYTVTAGNIVYHTDLNNPLSALDTGLTSLMNHIRTGEDLKYAADEGTANTYVMSLTPTLTEYATGLEVWLKPANTNTGSSTLNIDGLGAKTIKRFGLQSIESGDLLANYFVLLKYDGTYFQIVSSAGSAAASAASSSTAAAVSAAAASASETAAAASAAAINLPAISGASVGDYVAVNSGKTGYEFTTPSYTTQIPVTSGVLVTGGIDGFELEYASASTLTLKAGGCLDSTRASQISMAADLTKAITPSAAWVAGSGGNCLLEERVVDTEGYYQVYALLKDSDDSVDFGLIEENRTLVLPTGYTKYRWVGFIRINDADEISHFVMSGKYLSFSVASENPAGATGEVTNSPLTVDHTPVLPEERIEAIMYGVQNRSVDAIDVWACDSSTNVAFYLGATEADVAADTHIESWGEKTYIANGLIPYSSTRTFRTSSSTATLLVHAVTLKR